MFKELTKNLLLNIYFIALGLGRCEHHARYNRQPWVLLASVAVLIILEADIRTTYHAAGVATAFNKDDDFSELDTFELLTHYKSTVKDSLGLKPSRIL